MLELRKKNEVPEVFLPLGKHLCIVPVLTVAICWSQALYPFV